MGDYEAYWESISIVDEGLLNGYFEGLYRS